MALCGNDPAYLRVGVLDAVGITGGSTSMGLTDRRWAVSSFLSKFGNVEGQGFECSSTTCCITFLRPLGRYFVDTSGTIIMVSSFAAVSCSSLPRHHGHQRANSTVAPYLLIPNYELKADFTLVDGNGNTLGLTQHRYVTDLAAALSASLIRIRIRLRKQRPQMIHNALTKCATQCHSSGPQQGRTV